MDFAKNLPLLYSERQRISLISSAPMPVSNSIWVHSHKIFMILAQINMV